MPEMTNHFSSARFHFNGIQGGCSPLDGYETEVFKGKKGHSFGMEDLGSISPLFPEYGEYEENMARKEFQPLKDQEQQLQQEQPKSNYMVLEEFNFNSYFPPTQPVQEITRSQDHVKPGKEMAHPFALASLELPNNYGSGFKKLKGNQYSDTSRETFAGCRKKLSAEEIIRVAGARYIQFSEQRYDDFSMVMHPFGYALSGLSEEETRDVELAHLLLAAAEKIGFQQFDSASKLLSRCDWIASEKATPVQKIVYYFTEALRERIDRATGRNKPNEMDEAGQINHGLGTNLASLACHQQLPFSQLMQVTSIQAIIENVGTASKVHLIDLEIRSGVQWTALMQAFAERVQRPLELLKITAVGFKGKQQMEETGKRLVSFAQSLNLPFSFKVVYVSCMMDIKEELFEIENGETVAVLSTMMLRTLMSSPRSMENLMRVIKSLNPSIMLVAEVEASHNSPSFVNRLIEALFFYSAYFDCLETCMDRNNEYRLSLEATFSNGIRHIVALEGTERIARSVKINVWRSFFSRYRMVEVGFSESSLYQASLVAKRFPSGGYCTIEKNGKCLIVGWKGTPLHSLSAWKFCRERGRSCRNYGF